MNNHMTEYVRQRGLQMFADWSDRVSQKAKYRLRFSAAPQ